MQKWKNESNRQAQEAPLKTRAGQYMCAECGKIFDTKKELENHQRDEHDPHLNAKHSIIHRK